MSRFLSARYSDIEPYTPGEQPQNRKYIKLNTNESPFPPAPSVIEAIKGESGSLNLYPDPECKELCKTIADYAGVSPENVFVGNGSDEVLAFSFLAFCDKDKGACYPDISYGFYSVYADLCCIDGKAIPLTNDYRVEPSDYFNAGRTIYIANPNAPTGISLTLDEIRNILDNNRENVVVIDEAYVDFGGTTAVPLVSEYDNLLVVRTFSKSRNLAGARLGFGIAGKEIIQDLNTMKFSFNPYNADRLSLVAGKAAIEDEAYFRQCVDTVIKNREYTAERLEKAGFFVLPSDANFIFAKKEGVSGESLYKTLREAGILVRHFNKPRINDFIRITIGTKEQMDALIEVLERI